MHFAISPTSYYTVEVRSREQKLERSSELDSNHPLIVRLQINGLQSFLKIEVIATIRNQLSDEDETKSRFVRCVCRLAEGETRQKQGTGY